MTAAEHARQREAVRLSLMLPETRADRRDRPMKRSTVAVVTQHAEPVTRAHVYVIPVVTETGRLL